MKREGAQHAHPDSLDSLMGRYPQPAGPTEIEGSGLATRYGAGRSFVVAVAGAAALPSFIESNFSSKVAYEAWCKQLA